MIAEKDFLEHGPLLVLITVDLGPFEALPVIDFGLWAVCFHVSYSHISVVSCLKVYDWRCSVFSFIFGQHSKPAV